MSCDDALAAVIAMVSTLDASAPGGALLLAAAEAARASPPAAAAHARAAYDAAWAALHADPAASARPAHARPVLSLAACLAAALALLAPPSPRALSAALRSLDGALVVGGPPHAGGEGSLASVLAVAVEAALPPLPGWTAGAQPPPAGLSPERAAAAAAARAALDAAALCEAHFAGAARAVAPPAATRPSLAAFRALAAAGPVLLRGVAEHWPALREPAPGEPDRRWARVRHLHEAAGRRTVPVEVCDAGGGYMGGGFCIKMMPFADFLDACVGGDGGSGGGAGGGGGGGGGGLRYLAQHDIFSQVPALRCDVAVPDYACDGDEPLLQAWLGPAGTLSNLHWDRAHNILVQVAGAKRFRLFPPAAGAALYAAPPPLDNTSALPADALRAPVPGGEGCAAGQRWEAAFPLYARGAAGAPVEGVLLPGDGLYIPPLWWHALEALTPSFSVSCWW
jgi:hypothetical protein